MNALTNPFRSGTGTGPCRSSSWASLSFQPYTLGCRMFSNGFAFPPATFFASSMHTENPHVSSVFQGHFLRLPQAKSASLPCASGTDPCSVLASILGLLGLLTITGCGLRWVTFRARDTHWSMTFLILNDINFWKNLRKWNIIIFFKLKMFDKKDKEKLQISSGEMQTNSYTPNLESVIPMRLKRRKVASLWFSK